MAAWQEESGRMCRGDSRDQRDSVRATAEKHEDGEAGQARADSGPVDNGSDDNGACTDDSLDSGARDHFARNRQQPQSGASGGRF